MGWWQSTGLGVQGPRCKPCSGDQLYEETLSFLGFGFFVEGLTA